MQTFTCFILKQFGVHITKMTIQEKSASMPIIGKIIGENQIYLITKRKCALIGLQMTRLLPTNKDVQWLTCAGIPMDGRNKNYIQITTRLIAAIMEPAARNPIVPTTIQKAKEGILSPSGTN